MMPAEQRRAPAAPRRDPWGAPPFTLTLAGLAGPDRVLRVESIVRSIPAKRLACFGQWRSAEVFVKLFFDRSGRERHWRRDARGVRAMLSRGIDTPALLHAGATEDGAARLLVFERITGAQNALEALARMDAHQARAQLLRRLVEAVARLHAAGLVQRDMHLKNFLVTGARVYALDGADIDARRAPLAKRASLDNLGLLFAQLEPPDDGLARALYPEYARARGWASAVADLAALERAIERMRRRREARYLRKIFRASTAFAARRDARQRVLWDRRYDSPALLALLADPDRYLESGAPLLKDGNTSTVGIADVQGVRFLIKRDNVKGLWHRAKRALRGTRAARAWRNAHLMRLRGVPTAAPVALLERRRGAAYFVSECVEGPDCRTYFASRAVSEEDRRATAGRVAALIGALRAARLSHGDLKATNILLSAAGPVLIDIDALRAHRSAAAFERAHAKDIARFMRNWESDPQLARLFEEALAR